MNERPANITKGVVEKAIRMSKGVLGDDDSKEYLIGNPYHVQLCFNFIQSCDETKNAKMQLGDLVYYIYDYCDWKVSIEAVVAASVLLGVYDKNTAKVRVSKKSADDIIANKRPILAHLEW